MELILNAITCSELSSFVTICSEANECGMAASSVLNLPKAASNAEINERHRALSLIFHPDKQLDPNSKEVATRTFLEIQKAYQGGCVVS